MEWHESYKKLPRSLVGLVTQGIYALIEDGEDIVTPEIDEAMREAMAAFNKGGRDRTSAIMTITDLQDCKALWTQSIVPYYTEGGAE